MYIDLRYIHISLFLNVFMYLYIRFLVDFGFLLVNESILFMKANKVCFVRFVSKNKGLIFSLSGIRSCTNMINKLMALEILFEYFSIMTF